LDDKNPFVYSNLRIYNLLKFETGIALQYFHKSKQMDATTDLIDEYISKIKGVVPYFTTY